MTKQEMSNQISQTLLGVDALLAGLEMMSDNSGAIDDNAKTYNISLPVALSFAREQLSKVYEMIDEIMGEHRAKNLIA